MLVPAVGVAAFSLVVPITVAMLVVLVLPDPLLPRDDQGVPDGRRRVHGHARQLRPAARAGRRRRRCSPTTCSPSRCRSRPAPRRSRRRSRCSRRTSVPISRRVHRRHRVREPARACASRARSSRSPPTSSSCMMALLLGVGRLRDRSRRPADEHPTTTAGSMKFGKRRRRHLLRRGALRGPARVRVGWRGGHRRRGDLERRARVQEAGVEERPHDARDHGLRRSASMFLGLSILAAHMHVVAVRATARRPSSRRSASSSSAAGALGNVLFYALQAGTMLILVLAANTSLRRLPPARVVPRRRQLHAQAAHQARAPARVLERDHRRSSVAAIVLRHRHRRQGRPADPALRDRRVHLVHALAGRHGEAPLRRSRSRGWRRGLFINGIGAFLSLRRRSIIVAITKFTHGAWVDHRPRPDPGVRCSCG